MLARLILHVFSDFFSSWQSTFVGLYINGTDGTSAKQIRYYYFARFVLHRIVSIPNLGFCYRFKYYKKFI